MNDRERTLRKMGLTGLHLQMALILWQVNGEENAVVFARMIRDKCADAGPAGEAQR